jgi:hypothetical protein
LWRNIWRGLSVFLVVVALVWRHLASVWKAATAAQVLREEVSAASAAVRYRPPNHQKIYH